MTEQSEHLSNAQIENYGIRTSGAGPETAQRDEPQRVNHQSIDGLRINDQSIDDQSIDDQSIDDQSIDDQSIDDQSIRDRQISDRQIDDQRVEAHLADCASCRNRLFGFHRSLFTCVADSPKADPSGSDTLPSDDSPSDQKLADSKVEGSRPPGSALADSKFANPNDPVDPQVRTAPTPECPSIEALRELAAGLTPDNAAPALTRHAATCDHCGPLLRTFTEDFSDDFSAEEQAVLNNLQSASAAWQRNTAREMLEAGGVQASAAPATDGQLSLRKSSAKPTTDGKPFFGKWVLVPAIAAVVVLAAITFPVYLARRDSPEKVEALLAQTYPEQRTTEMRWPGTPWGEPKETLGSATWNQPRTFLAARDAIQRQTPETLRRTEWVHLKAQSEILGGMPSKQLIADLTKATQSRPVSQSLMFDLAIANFRMGEVADDRNYYLRAKTVLDEMLASFPPSSAALFDRAVAEERLQLRDQAIADLTRCLTLESDPAWSAEIQDKIKKLASPR